MFYIFVIKKYIMEKNDQLLLQLIYMFHNSAMQGLGKIADQNGKINRNLDYVSQTIDILDMLLVKTKGNISEEIEKMIKQIISELKLNFVDEKSKKKDEDTNEKKEDIDVNNKKSTKKKSTKKKSTKKKSNKKDS